MNKEDCGRPLGEAAGFRQDTYVYTDSADTEVPEAVKWICPSFEIEQKWIVQDKDAVPFSVLM